MPVPMESVFIIPQCEEEGGDDRIPRLREKFGKPEIREIEKTGAHTIRNYEKLVPKTQPVSARK